jgi:hypothetical protein
MSPHQTLRETLAPRADVQRNQTLSEAMKRAVGAA